MQVLVQLLGAKRCLEVGTFTGYSALAVALALPADGRIICCDVSEEWTCDRAPLLEEGRRRRRRSTCGSGRPWRRSKTAARGTFDFAFIDADKANYWNYYERCLKLVRNGGLIAIDNTLWGGEVAEPADAGRRARVALRAFNDAAARDQRVDMRPRADRRRPHAGAEALDGLFP